MDNLKSTANTRGVLLLPAKTAVYALLGIFVCLCVYCMFQRVTYPFEIDWLEGELICHSIQLLKGKQIYAPPASEFIAEIYPPFYYLVSAFFFKLFGVFNFFIPRLISVFSFMGILWLIYRIAIREGGHKSIGIICAGFFISFYELHGPWYDVGRVDMLFFLMTISGLYVLAYYNKNIWGLLGGMLLLVLGCYTKQSGLYFMPFAALFLFVNDKRRGIVFAFSGLFIILGLFYLLNMFTDGWFGIYTFFNPMRYNELLNKPLSELPFSMLFEMRDKLILEIRYEIFYKLPIFIVLVLGYFLNRLLTLKKSSKISMWEMTAIPAIFSYFSIRPHMGSEKNDFMYLTLWGCMLLGLMLIRLAGPAFDSFRNSVRTIVYLLLALQLILILYSPSNIVPAPGSAASGNEFFRMVKRIPGPVYIPMHSFYGYMAEKELIFNGGAYWAYQILSKEPFHPDDLLEKLESKYFKAIILDEKAYATSKGERVTFDNIKLFRTSGDVLSKAVDENYELDRRIPYENDSVFRSVTGFMTRPEVLLKPRQH